MKIHIKSNKLRFQNDCISRGFNTCELVRAIIGLILMLYKYKYDIMFNSYRLIHRQIITVLLISCKKIIVAVIFTLF